MGGVKSTYFILLTSDFYNVLSKHSLNALNEIIEMGHAVGLHFDEARYPEIEGDILAVRNKIMDEAKFLSKALNYRIEAVSMHRPSSDVLHADIEIPGLINSYGKIYFSDFKYLSDSRCRWREPVEDIVESAQFDRLHILTHAFWYGEEERNISDSISEFVNNANKDRWLYLSENITDLESVMEYSEVR